MTKFSMPRCLVCGRECGNNVCPEHWRQLPLPLRQQWWRETNYAKDPPSKELTDELKRHFNATSI